MSARALLLSASAVFLFTAGAMGGGAAPRRASAPPALYITVGQPTVLSFPTAVSARLVGEASTFRVEALSPTTLRVTPLRAGSGVVRVETASGTRLFTLHAQAPPHVAQRAAGRNRPAHSGWAQTVWDHIGAFGRWVTLAWRHAPRPSPAVSLGVPSDTSAELATTGRLRARWTRVAMPRTTVPSLARSPALGLPGPGTSTRVASWPGAVAHLRAVPRPYRVTIPRERASTAETGLRLPAPSPRGNTSELAWRLAERHFRIPPAAGRTASGSFDANGGPGAREDEAVPVPVLIGTRAVPVAARTIPGLPATQATASEEPVRLRLTEGRSRILPARKVRTVQIDDPDGKVAEVQPISDREVLLLAKGPGTTTVRIWDERGRTEYEVTVEAGPERRQQAIQDAIGIQGVTARVIENVAILEGEVSSVEQVMRAGEIAQAFAARVVNRLRVPPPPQLTQPAGPTLVEQVQAVLPAGEVTAEPLPGQPNTVVLRGMAPRVEDIQAIEEIAKTVVKAANGNVVNLVQLAQPRQVRVQARMVSVDERLLRDLGIRWNDPSTSGPTLFGQETPSGSFRLLTSIQASINTIMEDARTELLSAPSTVVNSGATGYIMIGGEVPIPAITGIGTGQTGVSSTIGQGVLFRPFGILLSIEPVVEPGDEITLRLLAEVSTIDRNNSVTISGSVVPGFATKRALNELRLKAGDTLVIGGLISREEAKTVERFPILGNIPVFGSFFRSVRKERNARELLLFLTPELLPGPEPPAGLRQTPALKPDRSGPAGPLSLGAGAMMFGSGAGLGTSGGSSSGGGSLPVR